VKHPVYILADAELTGALLPQENGTTGFANVAAGMEGGAAALAETTQAPGQCCKVHSVAKFRVFLRSRIPKTDVRSQVHNLQRLNFKQQSGRTILQCQKEIIKLKSQNSKMMFISKPFLRASTAMRARFVPSRSHRTIFK
jgi:hypothetical protein